MTFHKVQYGYLWIMCKKASMVDCPVGTSVDTCHLINNSVECRSSVDWFSKIWHWISTNTHESIDTVLCISRHSIMYHSGVNRDFDRVSILHVCQSRVDRDFEHVLIKGCSRVLIITRLRMPLVHMYHIFLWNHKINTNHVHQTLSSLYSTSELSELQGSVLPLHSRMSKPASYKMWSCQALCKSRWCPPWKRLLYGAK